MIDWFKTLNWYEQVLWIVSLVFTLIFFYEIISTIIKSRPDKKRKYIFSNFFAFKNIAAFLSMMGWVSISGLYQGFNLSTSLILGILSGIVLMAVMSVLYYFTQKLKENQAPETAENINSTGEVISDIGRKRSSPGKIKISINGVLKITDAMTDFDHDVKTGTKIRVDSVTSSGIFIVKPMH